MPYSQSAQTWITQFYLQITPCLPFFRKRSPDGTTPNSGSKYTIAALQFTTHLSTPEGMKDWVDLEVFWHSGALQIGLLL